MNCSGDFECALDFHRRVERQGGDANGRACVPTFVAEGGDHEIGGAIHDFRTIDEFRIGIDEAAEANDAGDLVEIAKRGLELGQQINRAGARRLLSILDGDAASELAFCNKLAIGIEANLSGDDQQISGPHKADIIGYRRRRRGQGDSEIVKFLFHISGHLALPRLPSRRCPARSGVSLADRKPACNR